MKLKDWDYVHCADSFGDFGRTVYNYTACGPWMVAILPDGREVYYEDTEAYDITEEDEVVAIRVGSIVEGWDGELPSVTVKTKDDLMFAVDTINEVCISIFDEVQEAEEYDEDPNDYDVIAEMASGLYLDLRKFGEVN